MKQRTDWPIFSATSPDAPHAVATESSPPSICDGAIRHRSQNENCEHAILGASMEPQQIAELRTRLDTIERLLAQLSAELKGIRETLHAAAPAVSKDPEN